MIILMPVKDKNLLGNYWSLFLKVQGKSPSWIDHFSCHPAIHDKIGPLNWGDPLGSGLAS